MGEFSWAYIDSSAVLSSSGPTGSLQFRVADAGSNTSITGSSGLMWHTASSMLAITGSVEISGTLTANQYNINVIDKTVTNLSASGDTNFGDTADDTHQFTGSVYINGNLSASVNVSASAFYGDGSNLSGIAATSITGAMGQFNTTSGLLITSGSAYFSGSVFHDGNVLHVDNKYAVFGTDSDSVVGFNTALGKLVISGSATGLEIAGGSVSIDFPGGAIASGTIAGAGSYLGLNSSHQLVLTASATSISGAMGQFNTISGLLITSGNVYLGDNASDAHQFTGSVYINGNLSASVNVSASAFYGDGSNLSGIAMPTEISGAMGQFNTISGLLITSGNVYLGDNATVVGDLLLSRYIKHEGDTNTSLEFTDDKIAITAGGREFILMTEASQDTIEFNRLQSNNFNFIVNASSMEMLSITNTGMVINEEGLPAGDFRVESNQKERAIYLDSDLQFVQILQQTVTDPGTDVAFMVSGTIGAKATGARGVSVFEGDVVVSGSLYLGITSSAPGGGVSEGGAGTGAVVSSSVSEVNHEIVTTLQVDLHGLDCATGQGYVIGNASAAANAYLTKLDPAQNGVIYKAEMACVEMPNSAGTVLTDVDLVVSTAALAAQADAPAGANYKLFVEAGGNFSPGVLRRSTAGAALDSDIGGSGYYLYVVNGTAGTSTGEYNAGQFIIKLYGAKPF